MPITAVIGAQWGDEGKGKYVDILAQDAQIVARFNGGNNAGHTVINELGTFKLHLLPSGVFNPKATCIIGPGVVLDLAGIAEEINTLDKAGVPLKGRLFISPRCHLVMPYHRVLDRLYESAKGHLSTGTTGRGIGPTYADKAGYNGLRLADLQRRTLFIEKLSTQVSIKNRLIGALGGEPMDADKIADEYFEYFRILQPFIKETFGLLQDAVKSNQNILLEGAQATLLDTDWGTYPFVTGSSTLVSAATPGLGISPRAIERIIGVCKAYTTRVGNGPMPTELTDETGDRIRQIGREYGTSTGRPRRCGWLDAELVRFTAALNGFTELALSLLDVLDTFPEVKIATAYEWGGQKAHYFEGDAVFLEECTPVYESLPGWEKDIRGVNRWSDLPQGAISYIERIEQITGVPVSMIGTGPDRRETIIR
ncbi:adenylosuccinate synthase [Candidatus Chlorohelix sp.]|uniref:adenylosuccinate synthase n=1 Tax=Candidatus Chlorohelix sp. TaxID=3139201 RepID=UPI0030610FFB